MFDGEAAVDILRSLYKSAFFTLQALQFARTGEYPHTKSELAKLLEGDEARILESIAIGMHTAHPMKPRCVGSPTSSWDGPKASFALNKHPCETGCEICLEQRKLPH